MRISKGSTPCKAARCILQGLSRGFSPSPKWTITLAKKMVRISGTAPLPQVSKARTLLLRHTLILKLVGRLRLALSSATLRELDSLSKFTARKLFILKLAPKIRIERIYQR